MKFYKTIFMLLFFSLLLFTACGQEERVDNANNENININSTSAEDMVVVTTKQFSLSGMKLAAISKKVFSEIVLTTGMIDVPPENKAAVSTYYGGTVKNVHLLVGQKVKKGEILFVLENPEYVQMQQDYLTAKSKLKYLKAEYERQKTLLQHDVSSQKKYLKAESDYYTVLSDYVALGKKLKLLNIDPKTLDNTSITTLVTVKAPISGNITDVNITKGKYLSSNEVAVMIVNTEHLHLELSVFEKDIHKIKKGQTIKFTLPDRPNKVFEAEVFLIGKAVSPTERTINIHGHLRNEKESYFIPGMYIEAKILIDEVERPAINENAVVNVEDDYFVLVKASSDKDKLTFIKRKVKIGKTINGYTEIVELENLGSANEILISGAFNLIN